MSMIKLAYLNFKQSIRNYLSLILSLAFTILIFLNFQNLLYSDAMDVLGKMNKENVDIMIRAVTFVLGCFMFFFIWYSTNVFLSRRKKEIGIYIFMGLTNQKIGKLYMLETLMTGLAAMILGIGFGILTTQLFQMILMRISEIGTVIHFQISLQPILTSAVVYLIIYLIFVLKGYINIVRSSVLDMVSASRQNEYVRQKPAVLILKSVLGVGILGTGYYLAVKEGGIEVMGNVTAAVVFVVIGVYLLFGGLIPLIFQKLAGNKHFLYRKERNLWINNMIFRIRKNYRTYAIVCVLMLCSVTALATSFAMKQRYDGIVHFRNTYSFQIMSTKDHLEGKIAGIIEKENKIDYQTKIQILSLDSSYFDTRYQDSTYGLMAYSQVKKLAEDAGLDFDLKEPKDNEIIDVSRLYLLSIITDHSGEKVTINKKSYQETAETSEPYLGYLQELASSYYIVNDKEFERLSSLGQKMYVYNYKLKDIYNVKASQGELKAFTQEMASGQTALVTIDPDSSDIEWIKVMYSFCVFMFMVFILASGSILFMKVYNDAFEEKERYAVLRKLGIAQKTLKKAAQKEMRFAYAAPFLVMAVSSYFSVHALAKMMSTDLLGIQIISIGIIFVCFYLCYRLSLGFYLKNAEIHL